MVGGGRRLKQSGELQRSKRYRRLERSLQPTPDNAPWQFNIRRPGHGKLARQELSLPVGCGPERDLRAPPTMRSDTASTRPPRPSLPLLHVDRIEQAQPPVHRHRGSSAPDRTRSGGCPDPRPAPLPAHAHLRRTRLPHLLAACAVTVDMHARPFQCLTLESPVAGQILMQHALPPPRDMVGDQTHPLIARCAITDLQCISIASKHGALECLGQLQHFVGIDEEQIVTTPRASVMASLRLWPKSLHGRSCSSPGKSASSSRTMS